MRVGVDVRSAGGEAIRVRRGWLGRRLEMLVSRLKIRSGRWDVLVVNDDQMRRLHQRAMGISSTTDVLTFDLRERKPARDTEGADVDLDTVTCMDEARRRAKEFGHTVDEELLLYCVHSLLHVQGYDDRTARQAARMHLREDELLATIRVGSVFYKTQNPKLKTQNAPPVGFKRRRRKVARGKEGKR